MLSSEERAGLRTGSLNSYSDVFRKALPYYLSLGMTQEEFWDGESDLVIYYRKAEELKTKRANQQAWLQGRYFLDALTASPFTKAFMKKGAKVPPYPQEPYPLDFDNDLSVEERKEKQKQDKGLTRMQAWMKNVNGKLNKK